MFLTQFSAHLVLRFSFHDLTCLADVSVLRPDSRSDGRSVRTQNPEHGPPSSRINLKLDGWAWLLVLSPPSVSHFYSSFSWLFHICAARYMWLHCWPPTSTIQLMYRYCGFTAFAYVIKSLVPIVQNISFRLVLELTFFLAVCTIIAASYSRLLYKNFSLRHVLLPELKRVQNYIALCKISGSLNGKPPRWTSLLLLNLYSYAIRRSVGSDPVDNENICISKGSVGVSVFELVFCCTYRFTVSKNLLRIKITLLVRPRSVILKYCCINDFISIFAVS